jgi:hypothetical protein
MRLGIVDFGKMAREIAAIAVARRSFADRTGVSEFEELLREAQ